MYFVEGMVVVFLQCNVCMFSQVLVIVCLLDNTQSGLRRPSSTLLSALSNDWFKGPALSMIPFLHRLVIAVVVIVVQGIHSYVQHGPKEHPGFRLEDNTVSTAASKGGCSFLDHLVPEFSDLTGVESLHLVAPEENQQHWNDGEGYKCTIWTVKCNHQYKR